MQDFDLDERDLRLLHALQIRPRAAWSSLAPVVGGDPVTLARRWNALQEAGLAWMIAYRGSGIRSAAAIVEIECAPSSIATVTEDLARDGHVISIDQTAGGRDLMVTVLCATEAELSRFIVDRIPSVNGIRSTRSHRVIKLLTDARTWRLRSLQANEVKLLERNVPQPATGAMSVSAELEEKLTGILQADGRASMAAIAERLGVSPARAKSALSTILGRQRVALRLEIARPYSPWPLSVWYFLRVPAIKVEAVAGSLAGLEEVRLVVTTGGTHSILMTVWLRRIEDMTLLERQLGERLPYAEIMDRSIVLRTPKHMGHRLNSDGKRIV